jgi:hypothetical protein
LPSAFICGVRVATIDEKQCVVSVNTDGSIKTHSILCILLFNNGGRTATGALVMFQKKSGRKYRCLLLTTKEFFKKSNRKNYFTCNDGI